MVLLGLCIEGSSAGLDSAEIAEAAVFASLKQGCLVYPNSRVSAKRRRDWWKYKWCPYDGEIYQYHEEDGVVKVEYSLGSLAGDPSLARYPGGRGTALTYWYDGGQHCHEINRARRTEVSISAATGGDAGNGLLRRLYSP